EGRKSILRLPRSIGVTPQSFSTGILHREPNLHFQATTVSIARANAAAVNHGDSLRDGETQAASSGLVIASFGDAVKRLKQTRQSLLGHAIAAVSDQNSRHRP